MAAFRVFLSDWRAWHWCWLLEWKSLMSIWYWKDCCIIWQTRKDYSHAIIWIQGWHNLLRLITPCMSPRERPQMEEESIKSVQSLSSTTKHTLSIIASENVLSIFCHGHDHQVDGQGRHRWRQNREDEAGSGRASGGLQPGWGRVLAKKISRLALELSLKANILIFAARTVLFQYIFCFPDALQTRPDRHWTEQRQASIQSGWIVIKISVL